MFSPQDGISSSAYGSGSVLTNSSDDDMLDIRGSENGRNIPPSRDLGGEEEAGSLHNTYGTMPAGLSPGMDDLPDPGMGQYDDFHTIDWQRDIARDRMRHRHIIKKKKDSICDMVRGAHDAWSGWLCVLLVGLCSGVMAGIIDIGATWLTDLKFGICPSAFYLNKEQCCWSSNETVIGVSGNCSLW